MTRKKLTTDRVPDPPEAPDIRRTVRIPPEQWAGLVLLIVIVALGAAGLFERKDTTVRFSQHDVDVQVTYPIRAHYREDVQFVVRIEHHAPAPIDTVRIHFPAQLFRNVADLQFLPDASAAREVTITDVPPGDAREIEAELRPSYYGRRSGDLIIDAGTRRVTVKLTTFILP
jgi:hypothetical protein